MKTRSMRGSEIIEAHLSLRPCGIRRGFGPLFDCPPLYGNPGRMPSDSCCRRARQLPSRINLPWQRGFRGSFSPLGKPLGPSQSLATRAPVMARNRRFGAFVGLASRVAGRTSLPLVHRDASRCAPHSRWFVATSPRSSDLISHGMIRINHDPDLTLGMPLLT